MSPVSLNQCSLRDMRACFSVRPAKTTSWQYNAHTGNARKRHRPEASPQEDGLEVEDRGRASEDDKEIAKQSGNEIYIGFDKADSTPRKGRKGRLVTDDPKRYPDRDALSGGWAGGEVGLQEFVKEEAKSGQSFQKAKVIETNDSDGKKQKKAVTEDGEVIYLGFSKEELELRKSGGKGRFIKDDPRRYPDRENIGFLPGITGGFAGGEKGVKQFVESGDIKFDQKGKREFSPVILAGFVAFGVTTGAILLNSGVLLSEQALGGLPQSQAAGSSIASSSLNNALTNSLVIDEKTRLLLNAALVFLGLGAALIGARAVAKQVQERSIRLKDDAVNIGKASVFWLAVLLAALYIIDYQ